jgi:uncharacterized membrane protein
MAKPNWTLKKVFPYLLVIAGVAGIICSLVLIYDQIQIWENPNYIPACSLNPVVSCGTVINSKEGDIFRIPAPIWGLIAFPVLITVGAAILAGAKFKRWFWLGLQLCITGGVAFALWLFWLSMYRVHALCPFCISVDVVVYTTFWYTTLYNTDQKNIVLGTGRSQQIYAFIRRHHLDILMFWFLILIIWILHHFWYYYGQHLF